jgi:hypothetical protein
MEGGVSDPVFSFCVVSVFVPHDEIRIIRMKNMPGKLIWFLYENGFI